MNWRTWVQNETTETRIHGFKDSWEAMALQFMMSIEITRHIHRVGARVIGPGFHWNGETQWVVCTCCRLVDDFEFLDLRAMVMPFDPTPHFKFSDICSWATLAKMIWIGENTLSPTSKSGFWKSSRNHWHSTSKSKFKSWATFRASFCQTSK